MHASAVASYKNRLGHAFARTKLEPPRPRRDLVARERLNQVLSQAPAMVRLVLVSAPAGAGKTTLVAMALAATEIQPVWVALDADDDELMRFLDLLIHALERAALVSNDMARRLLEGFGDMAALDRSQFGRRVIQVLINDLPDPLPAPCALVLDDLHLLSDPAIFAALDALIERMPTELTLIMTTRHDPPLALGRLRARREVYELRLDDLQFTLAETTALLNDRLGLQLSDADIASLHQRTEGWAAGLTLLAASLERISGGVDRARFLDRLTRTDSYLFDYLADEVLNRQDPFVRMFLLETSILPALTPATCQMVTGRTDAAHILRDLCRHNLFLTEIRQHTLVPAVPESQALVGEPTYRYHDLFRTFLQNRLRQEAPARWRVLHRRAAATPDMVQRIGHLLQAEDWEAVADLVEQQGEDLVIQGRLAAVEGWAALLPAALLDRRPRIAYLRGVIAVERRDLDRGGMLLELALAALAPNDNPPLRGAALAALASCRSMMHDFPAASAAVEEALALPLPPATRVQLLAVRAHLAMGRGDWASTATDLDQALTLAAELRDVRALGTLTAYFFGAYGMLPPDGPGRIERLCTLIDRIARPSHLPLLAAAAQHRAWLLMWRGNWDAARAEAERSLALSEQAGGLFWMELEVSVLLPTLDMLVGRAAEAEAGLIRLREAINRPEVARSMRSWRTVYLFAQARLRWLQGRADEASMLYRQMCEAENEHEWPGIGGLRDHLWALLRLEDKDPAAAVEPARRAAALMELYRFTAQFSDARVLLAAALLRARRPEEALAALAPVLAECVAEETPGRLRWESLPLVAPLLRLAVERGVHAALAADVLGALGVPVPTAALPSGLVIPETGETLSAREVEVLRLIAQGATNSAIAAHLIISAHTVKHHVSHVLAKLGVATRAEAAARARDFGLG